MRTFPPPSPLFTRVCCAFCSHCSPFAHTCVWPSVCQVTYLVQAQLRGSIPQSLPVTRIKSTLSAVHNMQDKFSRNGKVVDGQVRVATMEFDIPLEGELLSELLVIYRQSLALEEGADVSAHPGSPKARHDSRHDSWQRSRHNPRVCLRFCTPPTERGARLAPNGTRLALQGVHLDRPPCPFHIRCSTSPPRPARSQLYSPRHKPSSTKRSATAAIRD